MVLLEMRSTGYSLATCKRLLTKELLLAKSLQWLSLCPDGDDRLYMNNHDNSYRYGDMFIEELMPFVEEKYRIRAEKQFRGISGLSMGGGGTLRPCNAQP